MRAQAGRTLGVVVVSQPAAVAGGDFEVAAHEIALGHAMGAHNAETAVFVGRIEVGVEGEGRAGFVLQDRGLVVDYVTITAERVINRLPDRFLDVENLGLGIVGGRVFGQEAFPAAETRHTGGARTGDHVVDIEVVAAFFQQESAGIVMLSPPVAHEKCAVIGRDMFIGFKRDDPAKLTIGQGGAQVDHVLRIAQDQADHRATGTTMARQKAGEFEGFVNRDHDRLFGEHLHTSLQPKPDMFEVEQVGRKHAEEFRFGIRQHRLNRRVVRGIRADHRQKRRLGVVVANHLHLGHGGFEGGQDVTGPQTDAGCDNAHDRLLQAARAGAMRRRMTRPLASNTWQSAGLTARLMVWPSATRVSPAKAAQKRWPVAVTP